MASANGFASAPANFPPGGEYFAALCDFLEAVLPQVGQGR